MSALQMSRLRKLTTRTYLYFCIYWTEIWGAIYYRYKPNSSQSSQTINHFLNSFINIWLCTFMNYIQNWCSILACIILHYPTTCNCKYLPHSCIPRGIVQWMLNDVLSNSEGMHKFACFTPFVFAPYVYCKMEAYSGVGSVTVHRFKFIESLRKV